ncbi:MAG: AAA family ATPase [Ilumatobacteraceae bacterium]
MLTELHIEDLGVIERLDLTLRTGMTAVTGETGAGKTMLVEALELLVGGRADSGIVRPGAAEARIDGRFVVGDDEVVLTRVVPADGRSRAYVDGRPTTVGALAEAAAGIVDLHGQHDHQSLLAGPTQRQALDHFGDVDLGPLRAARARLTELDAELEGAALADADEEARLSEVEDALADAVGHREAGSAAHDALLDDGGGRDAVAAALAAVSGRAPFRELADRLASLLAELDDVGAEARAVGEGIEEDPARLTAVRERRQLLRDLRRKYGEDLAEVIAYGARAAARLDELARFEERAAALDDERRDAVAAERDAAVAVGTARRAAAPALAAAVTERLRELALPHATIAIEVGEHAEDHPGDRVQFLLSANPGSPLQPLTKVASGGELARAMLALRLVLSNERDDAARTLVFDEVDAGIGGTAATAVGKALAEVGHHHQVLVVTHLAQVAALATTQVAVTKTVAGSVTTATAEVVLGDRRVDELARMLSGADGGDVARRHALQLLTG